MSIRFRLTLLYSALLAIVLTFFSVVLFAAVAFRLNNDLDRELDTRREQVESAIQDAVRREPLLFLRTILGLLPASEGEIRWNDRTVSSPAEFFRTPRAA